MSERLELMLLAGALAAVLAFFAALAYFIHAENMACIKAGGTMKERACIHSAEGRTP